MTTAEPPRLPLPPFDKTSGPVKVRLAEDAWNTSDAATVAAAYTVDSEWRVQGEPIHGRDAVIAFLTRKWKQQLEYRLVKELWGFRGNRMAVRFVYEFHDVGGSWFRAHGNELWEFAPDGRMQRRFASSNDLPIAIADRRLLWPLGRRPDGHAGLTDFGF